MKTINHIFFTCPHAVSVWLSSSLRLRSSLLQSANIIDKWLEVCNTLSQASDGLKLTQLFAFLLWQIWKDRNDYTFNQWSKFFDVIIAIAEKTLEVFDKANSETFLQQLEPLIPPINFVTRSHTFWILPSRGLVKLKFDTAIDVSTNMGITTVVIHNFDRTFLDWCYLLWYSITDPLLLESITCWEALVLAKSRGFLRIIIEGDSSSVIDTCKDA